MPDLDFYKRQIAGHTRYGKQPWARGEDAGLARNSDPDTSKEAAERLDPNPLEALVVKTLREFGPATIEQVADRTGVEWRSISPRFRPLANKGLIVDTGRRVVSSRGRRVIVWEAT